jgi:hypothetical protein
MALGGCLHHMLIRLAGGSTWLSATDAWSRTAADDEAHSTVN